MSTPDWLSGLKRPLLYLMGGFYVLAGVMHFITPGFYVVQIMPPAPPWHLSWFTSRV